MVVASPEGIPQTLASSRVSTRPAESDSFRPDIEGLRGVAVALVLVFHVTLLASLGWSLSGGFIGVDLFFVISGYLITGLLLRERDRTGRISFTRFYARRVRRILPAAAVVLVVAIPVAYRVSNLIERPGVMLDAISSSLSFANVRFALTTDYFNPVSYSPFLHFWSLGVEEQFYFLWPAVLTLAVWRAPRLGAPVALVAIVLASLAASILVTNTWPAWAFYMLPTRAWQLGIGGLLAVSAGYMQLAASRRRRLLSAGLALAGWIALVVLLVCAVVIDTNQIPYPGLAAIVPTVAGAVLIVSGAEHFGPGLVLRSMPVRFFGKISYSLYLWHWPVLVLGSLYLTGRVEQGLSALQGVELAGLSVVLATLSWWLIEQPFRNGRIHLPAAPSRVVAGGVAAMLVLAVATLGLQWRATGTANAIGAGLRPTIAQAPTDVDKAQKAGCLVPLEVTAPLARCVFGDPSGTTTAALVGDSHAAAMFPAVDSVAVAHHWRLAVYLKAACPLIDMPVGYFRLARPYSECETWNRNVLTALQSDPPGVVIVSFSKAVVTVSPSETPTAQVAAFARELNRLPTVSRRIIIADPPLPPKSVPDCLAANLANRSLCDFPRTAAMAGIGWLETEAAKTSDAQVIDLAADICPGTGPCPAIIDNMIVWRDTNHMTATFAASLAPDLDRELMAALAGH